MMDEVWHYRTADHISDVTAPNYFGTLGDVVRSGEMVFIVATHEKRPAATLACFQKDGPRRISLIPFGLPKAKKIEEQATTEMELAGIDG